MSKQKRFFDYDYSQKMVGWSYSPFHYKHFFHSLKEFFKEVKWAWQRVIRGYDDRMLWDLSSWSKQHIIAGLRELIDNNDVGVICKRNKRGQRVGDWLTIEQTHNIYRHILKHLLLSEEDFYEKYAYGDKWYEIKNISKEPDFKKTMEECHKHLNEGLDLFRRYFNDLWW